MSKQAKEPSAQARANLITTLQARFEKNSKRHPSIEWKAVQERLEAASEKLWSLCEMERTGGEPDVVDIDTGTGEIIFYDCSPESPIGRRSCCFDPEALASRKENKPAFSAVGMASEMGVQILSEAEYRKLQTLGSFDQKTSSWVQTPDDIRKLGGALFCDRRYNHIFLYHNGAESYYAARGFRASLRI
ncbi:MAG: DUF4256 domain-containing protein [Chitinophagaceae bacterium]|nr:DUF4256 domain-containing protein [Chitinophagaceae bacterium]